MNLEWCDSYLLQEVEPMGKESDHIHITALTSITGVPVCVEYMDRTQGQGVNTLIFPEDASEPVLTLLYKPGHYDLLYWSLTLHFITWWIECSEVKQHS